MSTNHTERKSEMGEDRVVTKVLPGFMELLPADQIAFNRMMDTIRSVYERFGFVPLDTPVIERTEILLAKAGGETEKQIYRFKKGENDLSLRFDLTVPLARYVSEHEKELAFPFRRYHIGKVYRGESPQKGRFREFYQCDIDIIGNEKLSLVNDAEVVSVIYQVFTELGIGSFTIRVNNRKLITGLLQALGIAELTVDVMRIIDKIEKVGCGNAKSMLSDLGISEDSISKIFDFLNISGDTRSILVGLINLNMKNETFEMGLNELREVVSYIETLGVPDECFVVDLSIARGLDYYTGTVYETSLNDYPKLGSICSGGRFDNLAEKYTRRKLPGVGVSIGLTRLFSQLQEVSLIRKERSTLTRVLVVPLSTEGLDTSLQTASALRQNGIQTEVYLEEAKVKTKFAYANKLGIPYVVIIGEEEVASKTVSLKNMTTGEQKRVTIEALVSLAQNQ
jgi:histidyl-tRNA synthetase